MTLRAPTPAGSGAGTENGEILSRQVPRGATPSSQLEPAWGRVVDCTELCGGKLGLITWKTGFHNRSTWWRSSSDDLLSTRPIRQVLPQLLKTAKFYDAKCRAGLPAFHSLLAAHLAPSIKAASLSPAVAGLPPPTPKTES